MYDNFILLEDGFHIKSSSKTLRMGDTIWVRIMRVDLAKRQVDMAMISEADFKAENAVKETVQQEISPEVVLPILPKHRSKNIELVFDKAAILFEQSNIKKIAKELGKEWYFSISETPDFKESLLILNLNPKAEADKLYLEQTHLPETGFDLKKWQKTIPYLEKYFEIFPTEHIVESYYCPFRSSTEIELSTTDLDLCLPLFKEWLKELSPKQIISFSEALEDYFISKELISEIMQLEILIGKRKIKATKGFIKNGRKKVAIVFLPGKDVTMSKENRDRLWQFAVVK
jgi:ribonuclease R